MAKKKKTCQDLYGVDNYALSEECKRINNENFGADYYSQTQEFKDRVKETRIKNYGVDHHMKNDDHKRKLRERNIKEYGVDWYSKTQEFKDKVKIKFLKKYGVDWYFKSEEFRKLCEENPNKTYGKTQNEIKEYVNSLGFNFKNNRVLLEGKEIDLLDGTIGIEYCGLFWHNEMSPQPRDRNYHYSKYKQCILNNVRLITIFEDEWKLRSNQCKSLLKVILGKSNRKIFARKCSVLEIDKKICQQFCAEYHLRGTCSRIEQAFGLFFDQELLGVLSLGKHHRGNNKSIVLNRLCFKEGVSVAGGSSKLFNKAIKWANGKYKSIISWSDNRWSLGNVYKVLNFVLDKELPPDYSYVKMKGGSLERLSKQMCCKKNINCPDNRTEYEHMLDLGYARIWDCGKKRWLYYLNKAL